MTGPRIFIVAGEPSGDVLGGRLIAGLRDIGGGIAVAGIGGERMAEQGMHSLVPLEELSIMGFVEILPRLPRLMRRLDETVAAARAWKPDVLVTIDSPGFTFRLASRLRGQGFPIVHYVAPQTWAWRPKRAKKLRQLFDRMLALLPFEPDWFAPYGIRTDFVGHPVIEGGAGKGDGAGFRARHGIAPDAPVLVVLPGSRRGEASRLLPVFRDTARVLAARRSGLRVVLPTVPVLADWLQTEMAGTGAVVVTTPADKFDAFAAADAALAASGTVSLELAMAGTPHLIAYRVNPLSAALARRLLTVKYVNLMNIVLDRPIVPELLQEDCRTDRLVPVLEALMRDGPERAAQHAAARDLAVALGAGGEAPSRRAARAVLGVLS